MQTFKVTFIKLTGAEESVDLSYGQSIIPIQMFHEEDIIEINGGDDKSYSMKIVANDDIKEYVLEFFEEENLEDLLRNYLSKLKKKDWQHFVFGVPSKNEYVKKFKSALRHSA